VHVDICVDCRELTAAIVRTSSTGQPERELVASLHQPDAALTGAIIGRYFLLERLGEGGMGIVYAAYDPKLDRRVAVKLIKHGLRGDRLDEHQRLVDEARALAKVSHPHVVTVHDTGEFDGQVFITMELVDGPSLRVYGRERSWRVLLPLLIQAGEGLAAAHRAGLVHRDFKPDNVLISARGTALVTDFGLAHLVTAGSPPLLAGTPSYMSPEQRAGQPTTPLSDQYSYCLSALELLANAPSAVLQVLEKGRSETPGQRFASMDVLVGALKAAPRQLQRRWALFIAAVLTLLIAAAVIGVRLSTEASCDAASASIIDVWSERHSPGPRLSLVRSRWRGCSVPW